MGRFRTALATISVGALLATSQAASADGATPITDEPTSSASLLPGTTGQTGPTGPTVEVPPKDKPDKDKNKPEKNEGGKKPAKEKKPQTVDPKKEIIPSSPNPQSAEESAPSGSPRITIEPNLGPVSYTHLTLPTILRV